MYITVTGVSQESEELITRAANFYASKLMSDRLASHIEVEIAVVKQLDGGALGDVDWLDRASRPRQFKIQLKNIKQGDLLQTLAHEMVHLKQYAKGELKDLNSAGCSKWGDSYFDYDRTEEEYYFLPWEVEAYGLEVGLWKLFSRTLTEKLPKTKFA